MNKIFILKLIAAAIIGGTTEMAGRLPNQEILALLCMAGYSFLTMSIFYRRPSHD